MQRNRLIVAIILLAFLIFSPSMALNNPKPTRALTYRTTDKLLVIGSFVLLVYAFYHFLANAAILPETIPLQYGEDGVPQRFGSKSEAFLVPSILGGIVLLLLLLSRVPQLYTYPCELTDHNHLQVYTKGRELILVAAFFLAIMLNVIMAEFMFAIHFHKAFPYWVFPAITAVLVMIPVGYLVRISRM